MTTKKPDGFDRPHRPGDVLLDHYFPDADEETRERAREAFRDFAHFLLRIGERIAAEDEAFKAKWEESSNSQNGLPADEEIEHGLDGA